MFTLRFAFKNIISRKSSLVIILFIAFSIAIMVMANAVFDGTGNGIEKTFSTSFTGDVVVRPKTDFPMSLFGDETPVTGELSELPRIIPYNNVIEYIKAQEELEDCVSQLTGQAALKIGDINKMAVLFGVDSDDYFKIMSGISIVEGSTYIPGNKGVLINRTMQQKLHDECNIDVKPGDEVQFISSNGSSYTLRGGVISGIYEYRVHNDLQDNIILCEPETVRSLLGIESMASGTLDIDKSHSSMIDDFDNMDDMFGDDSLFGDDTLFSDDTLSGTENSFENSEVVEAGKTAGEGEFSEAEDSVDTTWNYIICKLKPGENHDRFIKKLNAYFKKAEYNVTAVNWRAAAGMSAQYVYWMRLIFNIGIILLIGTGFIVVNNTLIIAAMDRTKETGALRAIGADRKFIAAEYLYETLLLTITAGILGCLLGLLGNQLLVNANITFSNSYLIQLFGGSQLKTVVTLSNLGRGMLLSLVLAIIGWLYPVHIALETSPVVAMEHI